jgi:ribosomal protein S6--L-glutamate ligase
LNAEAADLACRAAHATGAVYAGVDLIQNHLGEWRVLEVNAVPGWRALAATCQIDVARAVLLALQEERT